MPIKTTTVLLLLTLFLSFIPHLLSSTHHHHRHLLHQPFFPLESLPPTQPPSVSPQSQPQQHQPKYPFSATPSPPTTTTKNSPFFPTIPSPPPPPSLASLATFPANVSALIFPESSPRKPLSPKLVAVAIALSLIAAALIIVAVTAFILHYRKRRRRRNASPVKTSRSDSLRLYPANTATSDSGHKHPPPPHSQSSVSNTSSEFLYLGTLVNSRGADDTNNATTKSSNVGVRIGVSSSPYQKLGSPELRPLPPLPRQNPYTSGEVGTTSVDDEEKDEGEEEFFSPRGSSGEKESFDRTGSTSQRVFRAVLEAVNFGSRSSNSRTPSYTTSNTASPTSTLSNSPSLPLNLSSRSLKSKSPDSVVNFPAPSRPAPPPPPEIELEKTQNLPTSVSDVPELNRQSSVRIESVPKQYVPVKLPPPPPPPPPPARFWETPVAPPLTVRDPGSGPPALVMPTRPAAFGSLNQNSETIEKNEETSKPKLKPLHWDKVRASSDRAMVWDQLKSSSFQ